MLFRIPYTNLKVAGTRWDIRYNNLFCFSFSGPLPTIMETFKNNNKDVDHMETLEMEALRLSSAANSTEEEEDQPVDFSQNSVGNVMRTSILSKF